jgi:MFS family permease
VSAVLLVVFFVMAGAGLVLPVLPLFARSSFGVGYGAVGVGRLAVIALGSALTGVAPAFAVAVAQAATARVGSATALAALYTRVLRVVPTQQMARMLGIFYGAFNTGFIAGGAASGLVADRFGLAGPLLANAVVVVLPGCCGPSAGPGGGDELCLPVAVVFDTVPNASASISRALMGGPERSWAAWSLAVSASGRGVLWA